MTSQPAIRNLITTVTIGALIAVLSVYPGADPTMASQKRAVMAGGQTFMPELPSGIGRLHQLKLGSGLIAKHDLQQFIPYKTHSRSRLSIWHPPMPVLRSRARLASMSENLYASVKLMKWVLEDPVSGTISGVVTVGARAMNIGPARPWRASQWSAGHKGFMMTVLILLLFGMSWAVKCFIFPARQKTRYQNPIRYAP